MAKIISGRDRNPDAVWGNDEQKKFDRGAVSADEKFRKLMLSHHKDRYGVRTEPGTQQPRYVASRGMTNFGNGSPAGICADNGCGHVDF